MADRRLPDFRFDLFGNGPLSNHHRSVMTGVTIQVLPLRGDMARMRQFINSYLNFVDDDYPAPFYFKPAMPYVMLEVIDYPFLAVTSENMTVLSQHEVGFTVPLECYAIEDGERVFVDYASCTPFLYLDVQPNIISGRDVFGLPKIAVRFNAVELPMRPGKPAQILDMQLRVASPTGDGYRRFIEIFSAPPRYRAGVEDLFTAIPKAWARWFSISNAMWEQMTQLPTISGYERTRDLDSMRRMARANRERVFDTVPLLARYRAALGRYASTADIRLAPGAFDNISLKQFRDAEHTDAACYQSVVRSAMYLDRMNDAGPLYDPQIGDPTGGIDIKLYYTESQPLINSFGLRVEDVTDTSDGPIATLKPDFPFWQNVDLSYALGTNLYWRAKNSHWSEDDDLGPLNKKGEDPTEYITFGGGALQELPQRFVSPDSFVWIIGLPLVYDDSLPASPGIPVDIPPLPPIPPIPTPALPSTSPPDQWGKAKLQKLCDEYLENPWYRFEPIFPLSDPANPRGYIFMLVYHTLNSTEGFGPERAREVEFAIPVQWKRKRNDRGKRKDQDTVLGYGMLPLYSFSDSQSATITENEVFGRPTLLAQVNGLLLDQMTNVSPADREDETTTGQLHDSNKNLKFVTVKAGDEPPALAKKYPVPELEVKTSLLRALYSGASPEERVLIQVFATGPAKQTQKPDSLHKEGKSPDGDRLGRYLDLAKYFPVRAPWVGLKQIVDCRLPKKASYQAIVFQNMEVKSLQFCRQCSTDLEVRISRYESIPMVKKLGLRICQSAPGDDTTVDTIKADFAVWAHLSLEAQDGENLTTRVGTYESPAPKTVVTVYKETLEKSGGVVVDSLKYIIGFTEEASKSKRKGKKQRPRNNKPQGRQPLAVSRRKLTT